MPFPRQLLNQDEEIVLDVHPHWLFFAEPALASLGLLIVVIIARRDRRRLRSPTSR